MKKRLVSILAAMSIATTALCANSASAIFVIGNRESKMSEFNEKYENVTDKKELITSIQNAASIEEWKNVWIVPKPEDIDCVHLVGDIPLKDMYTVSFKDNVPDVAELTKKIGYTDNVKIYKLDDSPKSIRFDFQTDNHELNGMIIEKAVTLIKEGNYSVNPQLDWNLYLDSVRIADLRITMPPYPVKTKEEVKAITPEDSAKYNKMLEENGIRVRYRDVPLEVKMNESWTIYDYAIFPEDMTAIEKLEYAIFAEQNFGVDIQTYSLATNEISKSEDIFKAELKYREGDANEDGQLSIADAAAVLQYLGNKDKYGLSAQALFNADVNGDGLTTADAVNIQRLCIQ